MAPQLTALTITALRRGTQRFVSGGGKSRGMTLTCRKTSSFDGSPWGITFWAISFVSQSRIWWSISHSLCISSSLICSPDLPRRRPGEAERTEAGASLCPGRGNCGRFCGEAVLGDQAVVARKEARIEGQPRTKRVERLLASFTDGSRQQRCYSDLVRPTTNPRRPLGQVCSDLPGRGGSAAGQDDAVCDLAAQGRHFRKHG